MALWVVNGNSRRVVATQGKVMHAVIGGAKQGLPGAGGGGTVPFFHDFINQNVIAFTHNLNKYPAVRVEDTGDNTWWPKDINYPDPNNIVITFENSFSGRVWLS